MPATQPRWIHWTFQMLITSISLSPECKQTAGWFVRGSLLRQQPASEDHRKAEEALRGSPMWWRHSTNAASTAAQGWRHDCSVWDVPPHQTDGLYARKPPSPPEGAGWKQRRHVLPVLRHPKLHWTGFDDYWTTGLFGSTWQAPVNISTTYWLQQHTRWSRAVIKRNRNSVQPWPIQTLIDTMISGCQLFLFLGIFCCNNVRQIWLKSYLTGQV